MISSNHFWRKLPKINHKLRFNCAELKAKTHLITATDFSIRVYKPLAAIALSIPLKNCCFIKEKCAESKEK